MAARYIGLDQEDRQTVRRDLRGSYDVRSSVVHGAALPPDDELRRLTERTADLLRRVLRRCLADGHPPSADELVRELLA